MIIAASNSAHIDYCPWCLPAMAEVGHTLVTGGDVRSRTLWRNFEHAEFMLSQSFSSILIWIPSWFRSNDLPRNSIWVQQWCCVLFLMQQSSWNYLKIADCDGKRSNTDWYYYGQYTWLHVVQVMYRQLCFKSNNEYWAHGSVSRNQVVSKCHMSAAHINDQQI